MAMTYSAVLLRHFHQPVNAGCFGADVPVQASARCGDPRHGGVIMLQLQIDDRGVIGAARFQAYGCGATIAAASWVCDWLRGRLLAEAAALHDSAVSAALDLPAGKLHCAVLATTAVRAALGSHCAYATADDVGE